MDEPLAPALRRSDEPPQHPAAVDTSAPPASEDGATLRRRLSWLMGGRLLVATLLLSGTYALNREASIESFTPQFLLLLIGATYFASFVFALWLPRVKRLRAFAGVQLAWDLLLATGLVYVSGGAASGFTFLYGVAILMSALIVGPRATWVTAIASLAIVLLFGVPLATGMLPPPPDALPHRYLLDDEALGFALLSNTGGLVLVAFLASNLSERLRRSRGQLERAHASVATLTRLNDDIVRSLTSGLVSTNLDGTILAINPAGAELLGSSPDELIGTAIFERLPVPETPSAPASRTEGSARRVDGSSFAVGFTENPLRGNDGVVQGRLITFQDLTEIRELRLAAERAERLATLGRLAAGLAHEIRNPLSSILGSVELVREGAQLDAEEKRLLGIVIGEVERLDGLVNTMLGVSIPRAPERDRTDLSALAEEVVDMALAAGPRLGQPAIAFDRPESPVYAEVDGGQMRQVVWNLLKNAIQASQEGMTVRVRVLSRGSVPVVEVIDEGVGISPEIRARLFDTFYSARPHGVGLGLSFVKQIVEAHGGAIEVESEPGKGATFRVILKSLE
jgi:two-component system sensor histidine kinase PilS (NtrC family)